MKTHNTKRTRAKRLARWLVRLAQCNPSLPLYGWAFYRGIPMPILHP